MTATTQPQIDRDNAAFWDELCGTTMARSLRIRDQSPESLRRFDAAYLAFYPYLAGYLPSPRERGEQVLEVGLGYGTVGQLLAERGFAYHGVDIAPGPVALMRHRLAGRPRADVDVRVGSALELPHDDASLDAYVSIGCLHHTGDVPRAVAEAFRVLRAGGRVTVMLYNARSFRRRVVLPTRAMRARLRGRRLRADHVCAAYDVNAAGASAPHTEFFTADEVRRIFGRFEDIRVQPENFDAMRFARGRVTMPREHLLGRPARRWGLDLYVTARKPEDAR